MRLGVNHFVGGDGDLEMVCDAAGFQDEVEDGAIAVGGDCQRRPLRQDGQQIADPGHRHDPLAELDGDQLRQRISQVCAVTRPADQPGDRFADVLDGPAQQQTAFPIAERMAVPGQQGGFGARPGRLGVQEQPVAVEHDSAHRLRELAHGIRPYRGHRG